MTAPPPQNRGSRARLRAGAMQHYAGDTLFSRIAQAVCEAECLPRKELHEAWEVARRVRRHLRGRRVVDLAAGHGLLAWIMLILDDSSPAALCVDRRRPASEARLSEVFATRWPRLADRIHYREGRLEHERYGPGDLLVSVHACGVLTDRIIALAIEHRTPVAVLPCCHSHARCETGHLEGWMPPELAIDATRAATLRTAGFRVRTQTIPADITPQNRLLIATP